MCASVCECVCLCVCVCFSAELERGLNEQQIGEVCCQSLQALSYLHQHQPSCFSNVRRALPGPQVGAEHQLPHQKSSTEDVLSAAAEEVQPAKDNDGALLHLHHRVHPHLLHHHLVRCCHCQ